MKDAVLQHLPIFSAGKRKHSHTSSSVNPPFLHEWPECRQSHIFFLLFPIFRIFCLLRWTHKKLKHPGHLCVCVPQLFKCVNSWTVLIPQSSRSHKGTSNLVTDMTFPVQGYSSPEQHQVVGSGRQTGKKNLPCSYHYSDKISVVHCWFWF